MLFAVDKVIEADGASDVVLCWRFAVNVAVAITATVILSAATFAAVTFAAAAAAAAAAIADVVGVCDLLLIYHHIYY